MGRLRLYLMGIRSPADGRSAPQEAEEPRGGPECPRQEEGADDRAGAAGGGAGGGGKGLGEMRGWRRGRNGAVCALRLFAEPEAAAGKPAVAGKDV